MTLVVNAVTREVTKVTDGAKAPSVMVATQSTFAQWAKVGRSPKALERVYALSRAKRMGM